MEFFDYDPFTGITSYWEYDEDTGKGRLRREHDAQAAVDLATRIRNERVLDDKIKEDDYGVLHAIIPPGVEMELRAKGIDIYDRNCTRRLLEEIGRNYPYLKTTSAVHIANE